MANQSFPGTLETHCVQTFGITDLVIDTRDSMQTIGGFFGVATIAA
jgi:hypothetical protein